MRIKNKAKLQFFFSFTTKISFVKEIIAAIAEQILL
jgi:hypothetical protein